MCYAAELDFLQFDNKCSKCIVCMILLMEKSLHHLIWDTFLFQFSWGLYKRSRLCRNSSNILRDWSKIVISQRLRVRPQLLMQNIFINIYICIIYIILWAGNPTYVCFRDHLDNPYVLWYTFSWFFMSTCTHTHTHTFYGLGRRSWNQFFGQEVCLKNLAKLLVLPCF